MVDLSVKIGKLELKNPVMVASGTFGYGTEYSDLVDPSMLGAIVTKAITLHPREGNPMPRLWETPCGMLNSIGLQNVGVSAFLNEKLSDLLHLKTKVIVNLAGSTVDDFVEVAERLEGSGIHGMELNISCPNVDKGGMEFGMDPQLTHEVASAVRRVTDLPILAKLTPNAGLLEEVADAAASAGCDGLTVANTFLGLAVDIETRRPRLGGGTGGLSGPALKPLALHNVWRIAQKTNIPVVGSGGISSGEDVVEFILCGATAIQIGTANFFDPKVSLSCLDFIQDYCERRGVEYITDLIGKADM